jgi:DNA-binding XRE family transcriptional regulator
VNVLPFTLWCIPGPFCFSEDFIMPPVSRPRLRMWLERQRRFWTQYDLADASGLTQTEVSQIESGRLIPTAPQLAKLAVALVVSPAADLLKPAFEEVER